MAENLSYNDGLIGSALIRRNSRIAIADEVIYIFMGVSYSFTFADYIHPDHKREFIRNVENCKEDPITFISKCRNRNGEYIDISVVLSPTAYNEEELIKIEVFDIGYMAKNYRAYAINDLFFSSFVKLSDKINFVYDVEKAVISVYDKENSIFSGSLSDYRDLLEEKKLISPDYSMQLGQFFNAVEEANGDGLYKMDTSIFSQEGQFFPTIVNFSAIESNSRVAYIVGFWSDGRAMSAVETYASNLANLDPLTNLLNKKAIKDYAQEALAKAKADGSVVTFVLIDLDNFKEINDRFGHMFGDSTIVSVARIMSEAVGSRGVVGRVGGDEFFIVLTGYPDGDPSIRALLKTIRSNVEWYFAQKVKDAKFTCSVGTASYPADTEGYDNLYKLADHCLYIAKVLGRNRYIIYTESLMGSVEEILKNSTVVRMENYVSDAEKYKHLADIIRRINQSTDKTVEMNKIFGELLPLYDINSAHYCLMGDSPRYCGASDKDIPEPYEYIRQYDTYKDLMNETGFLAIGNYVNSKERLPELVEYMLKNEICSLFIVSHKDEKGEAIGLFVFEAVKHFKNWSEFDKRMLVMICSLLEYLL